MIRILIAISACMAAGACTPSIGPEQFIIPDERLDELDITLRGEPASEADLPEGTTVENFTVETGFGPVEAVFVDRSQPGPLILYCGGNLFRTPYFGARLAEGMIGFGDILMFDYPGYAGSAGSGEPMELREASRLMGAEAERRVSETGQSLALWGQSLGGIACSEAARTSTAELVVMETTAANVEAAVDVMVGPIAGLFVSPRVDPRLNGFDVIEALADSEAKILVLVAGQDEVLPAQLSRDLAEMLEERGADVDLIKFPDADHNNVPAQQEFEARLAPYFEALVSRC